MLSSCPVNSSLAHMERIVSEVLRKMVRKYSSKRPEVIAVAVENTVGVLAEDLKTRMSGKSRVGFGLSSENQPSDTHRKKSLSWKIDQADDESTNATNNMESQIGVAEGESSEDEQSLPMADAITSLETFEGESSEDEQSLPMADEQSTSLASTTSESIWESFEGPLSVQPSKVDNIFISEEDLNLSKNEILSTEELKPSEYKAVARKTSKRNKWKPEEIKRLIKKRAELDNRFQAVKGRMILWEEISASLSDHGINQTPAQCKSLWASLVQKYEESRTSEKSKKSWPYFAAVDNILSIREAT